MAFKSKRNILKTSLLFFSNSNLPAKSQQEELKHRQEYEKMIEIAKKKGILEFINSLPLKESIYKYVIFKRAQRERVENENLSATNPKRRLHGQLVEDMEHRNLA